MKSFMQFNELADNPYNISLKKDKWGAEYEYRFKTDQGLNGTVTFWESEHPEYDDAQWEIVFEVGGSEDETGLGDEFRIFATVIRAIREFIKKENPKYMTLSAKKTSGARGREGLYAKLLRKYMGSKYSIKSNKERNITFFDLEKK